MNNENVVKYKEVEYPAVIRKEEDGTYLIMFPDFPGCITFGYTYEEAMTMGADALSLWLEVLNDKNEELFEYKNRPIFSNIRVSVPV
jgi:predicted RNase H-like HicB family nuclease